MTADRTHADKCSRAERAEAATLGDFTLAQLVAETKRADTAEARLEAATERADRAEAEAADQMASKLEAQMALMAITKALNLTLADMGEGWKDGVLHILARIEAIVDESERGFRERDVAVRYAISNRDARLAAEARLEAAREALAAAELGAGTLNHVALAASPPDTGDTA